MAAGTVNWQSWTTLSNDELAAHDVAEINLSIAHGLPGAENLDIAAYLSKLDRWADQVRAYTERSLPRFRRTPAEWWNCESRFRILCMVTVLQRDLGVSDNMDFVEGPRNASDSRTHFIHGPLSGFGGTCVNLPVLYLAVGRRLGYPLKRVSAKEHLFVRWRGAVVFNIEATSIGFEPRSDEYHTRTPRVLSPREAQRRQVVE
jgi:hypothetical protein